MLQTVVLLSDQPFESAADLREPLDVLFGLQIPTLRLQAAIDQLVTEGKFTRPNGRHLAVETTTRTGIRERIREASDLQQRVRGKWIKESKVVDPSLDELQAWSALQAYLSRAFRQHGMQTVALLSPLAATSTTPTESLRSLLNSTLNQSCDEGQRGYIERAISHFLRTVATDEDRAHYIAQLADGAFAYYSLTVPPDVADQLRSKLEPLTLFLDTNFLFGILDLHANPLVEVSQELVAVINEHGLPFTLQYHDATEREMRRTIQYITRGLMGRSWPQAISRAAAQSTNISGLEQKYHAQNAITPISRETFFKPYQHIDVLLENKGIRKQIPSDGDESAESIERYRSFLAGRGREKPLAVLDHDVTLLGP